jgi:hypothetical protein
MIHDVPAALVPDLWSAVEGYLAQALKPHPFLTTEGLLQILLAGRAQLVLVVDKQIVGAVVMEVVDYPGASVGNVLALGGERGFNKRYLASVVDHLERWCREKRCDSMMLLGRPGWSRYAVARGGETLPLLMAWKKLR